MLLGCGNAAEQLYRASELGSPVAGPLPSGTVEYGYGLVVKQTDGSLAPGVKYVRVARVLRDEKGVVTARSMVTEKVNPWMGLLNREVTCLLETQVPSELFREPEGPWQERMDEISQVASAYSLGTTILSMSSMDREEVPAWMRYPTRESTLGDLRREYQAGRYGLGAFLEVARKNKDAPKVESLTPTNLPEYLATVEDLLTLLPEEEAAAEAAQRPDEVQRSGPDASRRGVTALYTVAADCPKAFEGLTAAGFRGHGSLGGTTVETRNLGGGRVQVEVHFSLLESLGSLSDDAGGQGPSERGIAAIFGGVVRYRILRPGIGPGRPLGIGG